VGERLVWLALLVSGVGCGGISRNKSEAADPERSSGGTGTVGATGGSSAVPGGTGAVGVTGGSSGVSGAGSGGVAGSSAGAGGGAGGNAGGAGGLSTEDSRRWTWEPCGTIRSTLVPPATECELGGTLAGGHPFVPDDSSWRMTGLAMSADGRTLVSMGGVTLAWDVRTDFSSSVATCVTNAAPEWPKVDVSPDGRWIAISGDGRRVVSRQGVPAAGFAAAIDVPAPCFPIELRFSPDGAWLAGAGWSGAIDVFRMTDLEAIAMSGGGQLEPSASLLSTCAPENASSSGVRTAMRSAFTPDGRTLVTELGGEYTTDTWRVVDDPFGVPAPHGLRGGFEVSALGTTLVSDCDASSGTLACHPYGAPFPKFSAEGHWIVAGATLEHVTGAAIVLDASALVGIFAPNGDVIAAGADNSLTRYCKIQ
jgi:hypothetical protein